MENFLREKRGSFEQKADQTRHIASARYPIPDVPVLYLVEPTPSNLQSITSDLSRGLYSPAYINFLYSIPRPLLEDFARQTAEANTSESIAQFYDQYLNFIVGEPDLFSLGMRKENTYWALNSARTKDEELDHVIDRIVSGLFSVMVTMGIYICAQLLIFANFARRNANYSLSKRCCSRNDISETRPKAAGPHLEFERQPLLFVKQPTINSDRNTFITTRSHNSGPKCGSHPHAFTFVDISVACS
jgi:hypothetical protein